MLSNLVDFGFEFYKKYYSSYRGIVVGFDDPLELGRVRISVPQIMGKTKQGTLAWHKGGWKGEDCGIQIPLQKGDMVWVEFEYGNAAYPLWSYGHAHGNQKQPKEFTEEVYGLKTPKGIIITCDDSKDLITVINKAGSTITIDGNKIYIGKGKGISIDNQKVVLGGGSALSEPLLKGNKTVLLLTSLLALLKTFTTITTLPTLPTAPNPATVAAITALEIQLTALTSTNTFTD